MTRINTNVSSLIAQQTLRKTGTELHTALSRLSTGMRINSGKDDPAGLIASENLRRDIVSARGAIANSERAGQMIATADSALGQVSNLLNDIRGLVVEASNRGVISPEQVAANQLQVDSSLEAIDRIAQTTTFQGRPLLNGVLDFQYTAAGANGTGLDTVVELRIHKATLGATGAVDIETIINNPATQALLTVGVNGFNNGALNDDVVFKVSGRDGSEVFTFQAGASLDDIVAAVNLVTDVTAVTATNNNGTLELNTADYGTRAFVDLEVITEGSAGTFANNTSARRATGTDVDATVNGIQARGDGNTLYVNSSNLNLELTVEANTTNAVEFQINGGGAIFQLGPSVVSNQQIRIGVQSLNTGQMGGRTGRLYELRSGNPRELSADVTGAAKIVDEVIYKVAQLRGRLGALQRATIDANIESLSELLTNLTEAESSIRDADFAAETAALTRAQVLTQSGTAVLGIANQSPQNVLSLLQ
ncbi:MAG: flagellin [Planctomycetaceae bacterium]|nr:flagellin [Planctomycetaceae bacterium]